MDEIRSYVQYISNKEFFTSGNVDRIQRYCSKQKYVLDLVSV